MSTQISSALYLPHSPQTESTMVRQRIVDSRRGKRPDSSPSIPKIRTPTANFCFSRATRTLPHPLPQADSPGRINIDSLLRSLSLSLYENYIVHILFLDSCQVSLLVKRQQEESRGTQILPKNFLKRALSFASDAIILGRLLSR